MPADHFHMNDRDKNNLLSSEQKKNIFSPVESVPFKVLILNYTKKGDRFQSTTLFLFWNANEAIHVSLIYSYSIFIDGSNYYENCVYKYFKSLTKKKKRRKEEKRTNKII